MASGFYVAALSAARQQHQAREPNSTSVVVSLETSLDVIGISADSKEEAAEQAERSALSKWPEVEGWTAHAVKVAELNIERSSYVLTSEPDEHVM